MTKKDVIFEVNNGNQGISLISAPKITGSKYSTYGYGICEQHLSSTKRYSVAGFNEFKHLNNRDETLVNIPVKIGLLNVRVEYQGKTVDLPVKVNNIGSITRKEVLNAVSSAIFDLIGDKYYYDHFNEIDSNTKHLCTSSIYFCNIGYNEIENSLSISDIKLKNNTNLDNPEADNFLKYQLHIDNGYTSMIKEKDNHRNASRVIYDYDPLSQ